MAGDIRFVCFDIGGVLVRHCRTWAEGIAAAGLELRSASDSPDMSRRRKALARRLTAGELEDAEFYRLMSETTRGLYSPEEIERIHHCWLGEEYRGVYGIVERLVRRHGEMRTGILSNTNAPHWKQLQDRGRYPTPHLLMHRHASHLLRLCKPDPAVFAAFQRAVGVAPSEIMFLEDLPENIAAARAAGWDVAPIDFSQETAGQIARALEARGLL